MEITAWPGARVRALRERMGLTQLELAHLVAATRNAVHYWETNKRSPTRPRRIALDALDREQNTRHIAVAERSAVR